MLTFSYFCDMRHFLTIIVASAAAFAGISNGRDPKVVGTSADIQASIDKAVASASGNPVKVTLKGGTYLMTDEIVLDSLSNVVIEGEKGKTVLLKGDRDIRKWHKARKAGIPENALEADLRGFKDLGEVIWDTNRVDIYAAGVRQNLARWPDKGFTRSGLALGTKDVGDTWIHVHGTHDGLIEYVDDRISRWSEEDDPRFHGYWYWDWCEDNSMRLEKMDTVARTIQFKPRLHVYGYRDSCRFYGFNLLCELDAEGEYYVHRTDSLIYWLPPKGLSVRKNPARMSMYKRQFAISLVGCSDVTLRNISLRGVRRNGISIRRGRNVAIEDCHIYDIGGIGVDIDGGKDHRLCGNTIEELGFGGIVAKGGDRKTLEPSGFVISDNVVQRFSLFKRTYQPAVHFTGDGLEISHNRFQWSSSSALRIEGNDVEIAYNQIFNVVEESDDQGGLDCYFNYSYRRINLHHNHWRDIRGGMFAGAAAIRFDDIVSGHSVRNNVFERCGDGVFGGVQINGGKDIFIEENVFYDCPWAVSGNEWSLDLWHAKYAMQESNMTDVAADSEIYLSRYPELRQPNDSNLGVNFVRRNLVVGAKTMYNGLSKCVDEGNVLIGGLPQPLSYYLNPDLLSGYGIAPLDLSEMGPRTR